MRALVPEDLNPDSPARRALNELAMSSLTRAAITVAHNKLNPNARGFAASRWGSEEANNIANVIRAASGPATTSGTTWAQPLSPIVAAFLANLVPVSAAADLLNRVLSLNLDGVGALSIPNLNMGLADFVKEGDPIPVVQAT